MIPDEPPKRLPSWLKRSRDQETLRNMKKRLRQAALSTVCEEARCPNICECFSLPTATFLILGDTCTRSCSFCSVKKGVPEDPNPDEPEHVALTAAALGLNHVVITSVTRDDLPDGGASAFVRTMSALREVLPAATIDVLTPDFSGNMNHLDVVLEQKPQIFSHDVETISRHYPHVRPRARLKTSLSLLTHAKKFSGDFIVKSGFMVGLGETEEEILELLEHLRDASCDVVTIGQYLQPTRLNTPVARFWEPHYFQRWKDLGESLGLPVVLAGPLVRSSYRSHELLDRFGSLRNPRNSLDPKGTTMNSPG
ncbi:MAG: lipoyl synthase [Desulfomonilia bacterium]|nr:lipoyl synthase [Desulfomonilia bacterium]